MTSYLSALVTSKTNSYATSRFSYKLQVRCQQVKDALCHQPKGWSTNRTVTVRQTMQPLSDKLTSKCVTSYPSALVTSKTTTADCVTSYGMTEAQTEHGPFGPFPIGTPRSGTRSCHGHLLQHRPSSKQACLWQAVCTCVVCPAMDKQIIRRFMTTNGRFMLVTFGLPMRFVVLQ